MNGPAMLPIAYPESTIAFAVVPGYVHSYSAGYSPVKWTERLTFGVSGDDGRDPSEKDDERREDKDCAQVVRSRLILWIIATY